MVALVENSKIAGMTVQILFITWDIQKNVTNERFIDCLEPVNIISSHITITSLKICNVSWTANTMFFSLRGQPFDSEGGGGWHLLEINILDLKKLKINNLSSSGKKK